MKIDYCLKCGKAGLREKDTFNHFNDGLTGQERWNKYTNGIPTTTTGQKWCPRCNEWVNPCNKPYIGVGK
jgi:hypothetical protein